ncbi:MAG: hypothetical protein P8M61_07590 [Crocinitomicaceae bacterium]|nr:hypothetical protein [Crocinitomicaceae bacterium]MDG2464936.1 hypothetical protein [Crocinitomicaceae bacterium]
MKLILISFISILGYVSVQRSIDFKITMNRLTLIQIMVDLN